MAGKLTKRQIEEMRLMHGKGYLAYIAPAPYFSTVYVEPWMGPDDVLEAAYRQGFADGIKQGEVNKQTQIKEVLGL